MRMLRAMRRLVALVLVLALTGTGAALAARGDPQKRITPADQARAKAMLVRPADLPGFRPQRSGPEGDFYCEALDESDLTLTGEAEGRQLALGTVFIGSAAQVYRSLADARASWRRATSPAGVRCAQRVLSREFANTGGRLLSLRKISFPRLSQQTVVFRAKLVAATAQGDLPVYIDLVALMHSRAHATMVIGSALVAPTRAEEVRLARVVAKRMATAMRGS
jgi:hypothetical protein